MRSRAIRNAERERHDDGERATGCFPAARDSTNISQRAEFVEVVTKPKHSGEVNYTLISRNREYAAATKRSASCIRRETRRVVVAAAKEEATPTSTLIT